MIEYAHQLEYQEDMDELRIEVADSPSPSVDPNTTTITHSRSRDSGDTTILPVMYNIGNRYYDVHHNAASMYTPEILATYKQIRYILYSRVSKTTCDEKQLEYTWKGIIFSRRDIHATRTNTHVQFLGVYMCMGAFFLKNSHIRTMRCQYYTCK